jgi:hypothetical protein
MRKLILAALAAVALGACGDVPVGPVDHSCHTPGNTLSTGSGCEPSANTTPLQRNAERGEVAVTL